MSETEECSLMEIDEESRKIINSKLTKAPLRFAKETSKGVYFKVSIQAIPKEELPLLTNEAITKADFSGRAINGIILSGNKAYTDENKYDYLIIDGDDKKHYYPNRKAIIALIVRVVLEAYPKARNNFYTAGKTKNNWAVDKVSEARCMASILGRKYTKCSYPELARHMFDRGNHTSVLRYCQDWLDEMTCSAEYAESFEDLEGTVLGNLMEMFPDGES